MSPIDWSAVINRAANIVRSYNTSVTLRQLHYRLVSEQAIPNTSTAYKRLSSLTARLRREGAFPELIDRTRAIHRHPTFTSPAHAMQALVDQYRLDRTAGQETSVYLAVEKAGMVLQREHWFGHLGVPVLALGGYASQSYVDQVVASVMATTRPAILLYAGDHDPSGEDIDRDFLIRTGCWAKVIRVALTAEQVQTHQLPINPGKATDSRAASFVVRHGALVQVELDALDPHQLRQLYADALAEWWDPAAYQSVLAQERAHRAALQAAGAHLTHS